MLVLPIIDFMESTHTTSLISLEEPTSEKVEVEPELSLWGLEALVLMLEAIAVSYVKIEICHIKTRTWSSKGFNSPGI